MSKLKRLYCNLIIFGIFFLIPMAPWYVPFIFGIVCAWYVEYFELAILGFVTDLSFASGHFFTVFNKPFPLPFTVLAIVVVISLQTIKRRIRLYQ